MHLRQGRHNPGYSAPIISRNHIPLLAPHRRHVPRPYLSWYKGLDKALTTKAVLGREFGTYCRALWRCSLEFTPPAKTIVFVSFRVTMSGCYVIEEGRLLAWHYTGSFEIPHLHAGQR